MASLCRTLTRLLYTRPLSPMSPLPSSSSLSLSYICPSFVTPFSSSATPTAPTPPTSPTCPPTPPSSTHAEDHTHTPSRQLNSNQIYSDYVPFRRTKYIPHTGRVLSGGGGGGLVGVVGGRGGGVGGAEVGRWDYVESGVWRHDGYTSNHDYYGVSGLFKILFNNKDEWGGRYYFAKRGAKCAGKIFAGYIFLAVFFDPYGTKTLKKKIRAKQEKMRM
eukprot:GHVQ01043425.1.p1 GENE.GHVQ01043425.1~~GHVQ01043425.1.p1  ORF type:complete len:218 (-),score=57.97 GHVQ01043425.1:1048-1701(-)